VYSLYNILNRLKLFNPPGPEWDVQKYQDRSLEAFSSHASTLTARRWDPASKQCMYKIRNSWGSRCDVFDKKFRADCEKGQFWVKEQDARNLFTGITWIR
jgi:hypothetical protein